jgi:branched-chain amino acid transport system substrate-binding protein
MTLSHRYRCLLASASMVASVAALTACASSGATAGSTSSSSAASGSASPYKIMVMGPASSGAGVQTPPQPEVIVGAQAAARAINAAGGVDGHPIQLETCDSQGTKNGGVICATKAVQDKVLAVVGALDFYGDYINILKSAGIPNVGPLPIQNELTDPNSYPIEGGASVVPAAVVTYVAKQGDNSLAYVGNSSVYTSAIPLITKPVVARHTGFGMHLISIPATAVDVAPYVTEALRSKYVDLATFSPTATLSFVKDYLAAGGQARSIITSASTLTPALIKSLGAAADGIKITSLFVPATDPAPAARQFSKDMHAVDPRAPKDEVAENSYLAVRLFAAAVKGQDVKSGKDVAASLAKLTNVSLGLTPPVSFDKPVAGSPAPRVFNDGVVIAQVTKGVVVSSGGQFFSAYTGATIPG